ncbi:MAG: hypothetical protein HQL93_13755, partial [Magnetococcales bacterium]|nr:hypothetical protein [Magnetococcales bacterium]
QKNSLITIDTFQDRYQAYLKEFQQPEFWESRKFLILFSGKDMANMMRKTHQREIPPLEDFFIWAIKNMDWRIHPDLVELENKLSNPPY